MSKVLVQGSFGCRTAEKSLYAGSKRGVEGTTFLLAISQKGIIVLPSPIPHIPT